MKNIADVYRFMTDVLDNDSAKQFEDDLDTFVYYVRMSALTNPNVTDTWMKTKLRKYASSIIMSSIKGYLDRHYSDTNGDICLNVGFGMIYDKDMKPIDAVNKVKEVQRGMMKVMVSIGMQEFSKGRDLAYSMIERADIKDDPQLAEPTIEQVRTAISHLEQKLPNITKDEADELVELYAYSKAMGNA